MSHQSYKQFMRMYSTYLVHLFLHIKKSKHCSRFCSFDCKSFHSSHSKRRSCTNCIELESPDFPVLDKWVLFNVSVHSQECWPSDIDVHPPTTLRSSQIGRDIIFFISLLFLLASYASNSRRNMTLQLLRLQLKIQRMKRTEFSIWRLTYN